MDVPSVHLQMEIPFQCHHSPVSKSTARIAKQKNIYLAPRRITLSEGPAATVNSSLAANHTIGNAQYSLRSHPQIMVQNSLSRSVVIQLTRRGWQPKIQTNFIKGNLLQHRERKERQRQGKQLCGERHVIVSADVEHGSDGEENIACESYL